MKCDWCGREASYTNSVSDSNVKGYTHSECGYRLSPLCEMHAREAAQDSCSRVEAIQPTASREGPSLFAITKEQWAKQARPQG